MILILNLILKISKTNKKLNLITNKNFFFIKTLKKLKQDYNLLNDFFFHLKRI